METIRHIVKENQSNDRNTIRAKTEPKFNTLTQINIYHVIEHEPMNIEVATICLNN